MFYIKVSSKHSENLKEFLLFLYKFKNNNLVIKYFPKQKIKKFVTVLKSPHVYKSAQEQFEFRIHTKNLLIDSEQHFKFLYFLKKIQNNIFPFVNLKIKSIFDSKSIELDLKSNKLNPNKMNIQFLNSVVKKDSNSKFIKVKKYLTLFDGYGELSIKKVMFLKASLAQLDRATAF